MLITYIVVLLVLTFKRNGINWNIFFSCNRNENFKLKKYIMNKIIVDY